MEATQNQTTKATKRIFIKFMNNQLCKILANYTYVMGFILLNLHA